MQAFKITPLPATEVEEVKDRMLDLYGNTPELSQTLSDRSICRRCLRRFKPGEERLLFKYCPFRRESVFAESGPIFVHKFNCEFESLKNYPQEFRSLPLLLRAYDENDRQVIAELIKGGDAERVIDKFFTTPDVAYIHLRDGEYGCYVARIERAT
jgi:hypothetical protein